MFERTGDRTLDPQIKSLLLYQLSYPPDARSCIPFFELLCNTSDKKLYQMWRKERELNNGTDCVILESLAGMVELADT